MDTIDEMRERMGKIVSESQTSEIWQRIYGDDVPKAKTDIFRHNEICEELRATYLVKNKCYGNSFADTVEKYGNIVGVARMHDKFSRIEQLVLDKTEDEESLEDNLMDLANYCIMMVMINEK